MKRILFAAIAAFMCIGSQAQIVSSRSVSIHKQEASTSTTWIFRIGMNIMNLAGNGTEGLDSQIGYNATIEFNKPIGTDGAYWGMNFGLGSRGFNMDGISSIAHNLQYSPFTFGWKIDVAPSIQVDPHIGVYASYDYTSKMKDNGESISWGDFADLSDMDYHSYDAGLNAGIGIWYKRYNLDLCYQRGFINVFSDSDKCKTSNFLIRLGISF